MKPIQFGVTSHASKQAVNPPCTSDWPIDGAFVSPPQVMLYWMSFSSVKTVPFASGHVEACILGEMFDTVDEGASDVGRLEVTDELGLVATNEANDEVNEVDVLLATGVDDESKDELSEETKARKLERLDELGRPEAVDDNKLAEVEVPEDAVDVGMIGLGLLGVVEDDNLDEPDELVDLSSEDEENPDILEIDEESVG